MAVQAHGHHLLNHHPAASARATLRIGAYASIASGSLLILRAGPLARSMGISKPGLVALAGAFLAIYGLDTLGLAVGRRLRRVHILPLAVVDTACAAGGVVLLVSGADAFTLLGRVLIAGAAAVFGWFAIAEFRAARAL